MKNFVYMSDYSKLSDTPLCKYPRIKKLILKFKVRFHIWCIFAPICHRKERIFEKILFDFDDYAKRMELKIEAIFDNKSLNAEISVFSQYFEFFNMSDCKKLNYAIENADGVCIYNPMADNNLSDESKYSEDDTCLKIIIDFS